MTADETADETADTVTAQWQAWAETLDMILFRVCWPTGSVDGWKSFADKAFQQQQAANSGGTGAGLVAAAFQNSDWVSQLTSNPWHVAQDKTIQVGAVLARFLDNPPEALQKYFSRENNDNDSGGVALIGHSLGAAIVFQTLLQSSDKVMVDYAIGLGGAFVVPTAEKIQQALSHVRHKYLHAYSQKDQILQIVFRAANAKFGQAVAGTTPLTPFLAATNRLQITVVDDDNDDNKNDSPPQPQRILYDLDMADQIPVNDATTFGHSYANAIPFIADKFQSLIAGNATPSSPPPVEESPQQEIATQEI